MCGHRKQNCKTHSAANKKRRKRTAVGKGVTGGAWAVGTIVGTSESVGKRDGVGDPRNVGTRLGMSDGWSVGNRVVGTTDSGSDRAKVGRSVGVKLGSSDGAAVGRSVGW